MYSFLLFYILCLNISELDLVDGQELYVADPTTPSSLTFKLQLGSNME